jgi:hypothetical protein
MRRGIAFPFLDLNRGSIPAYLAKRVNSRRTGWRAFQPGFQPYTAARQGKTGALTMLSFGAAM